MHHLRMRKIFRRQTNHDGKSHRVYPPKIIQTSLLGRLHKKSYEHNDYVYVAYVQQRRVRKPPTDNISSPQNYFQTNYRSVIQH